MTQRCRLPSVHLSTPAVRMRKSRTSIRKKKLNLAEIFSLASVTVTYILGRKVIRSWSFRSVAVSNRRRFGGNSVSAGDKLTTGVNSVTVGFPQHGSTTKLLLEFSTLSSHF